MGNNENRGVGASTPPGESVADKINDATIDHSALEQNPPTVVEEDSYKAKQVEDNKVIFVPFEDFDGRVNQTEFHFREGIPTKVTKSDANIWLEAKKGYIK